MRQTVAIKGARENNQQDVEVEIPRDQLVVVTANLHWRLTLSMPKGNADSWSRCPLTPNALLRNSKNPMSISLMGCPLSFLLNRKQSQ